MSWSDTAACLIRRGTTIIEEAPVGPPVFFPDQIASLECWLDADQLGLADNAPVASWTDASGKGRHFTQATGALQPLVKTGILNGKPVVRFDGIDDIMLIPEFMAAATQGELFIVLKFISDPPDSTILQMSGSALTSVFYADGNIYEGWGSTNRHSTGNPVLSFATAFRLYNVRSSSAEYRVFIDAVSHYLEVTNPVSFDSPSNSYSIGDGTYTFRGDAAEICIFSTVLTTEERDNMHAYFNEKYALGINLTPPPVPTAGILGWWKADAITPVADGTAVALWEDSHTSNKDMVQATGAAQPKYYANQINGKPVLRFDGVDDVMQAAISVTVATVSVYMVIRHVSLVGSPRISSLCKTGGADFNSPLTSLLCQRAGELYCYRSAAIASIADPVNGVPFVYVVVFNGTNHTNYVNGTAGTAGASTGNFGVEFATIGAGYDGSAISFFANEEFAEMLIYNVAHDATTRASIESYLKTKYGIGTI